MGLEYNQYDKLKVDTFNDSVQASMNHIRFQEKIENMLYYFSLAKTSSKLYRSKMNDKDSHRLITGSNHDEFVCSRLCSPYLARPTQNLTYVGLRAW
jgi:hypothetical protein